MRARNVRPRRAFGIVLAMCALLGATAGGARASTTTTWDATDVPVSNVADLFPGDNRNVREPTVAIDPLDPDVMVAFAMDLSTLNVDPNQYGTNRGFRSTDGGASWTDLGPVGYGTGDPMPYSGDPVAMFDHEGRAYLASLFGDEEHRGGIYVHRSLDAGVTWSHVLAVPNTYDPVADVCVSTDKEWITEDPRTGRLYVTYTRSTLERCQGDDPTGLAYYAGRADMAVYMTSSDDHGDTWSVPQRLWRGYALGATPKVAPDGTIYVTFWTTVPLPGTACATAIGVIPARTGGSPFAAIVVARSMDGGTSWDFHQEGTCGAEAELLKPGAFVGGTLVPAMSLDRTTSSVTVAWAAYSLVTQMFTVKVISTQDGGGRWSPPVEVSGGSDHALQPALVADAGVTRLLYMTVSPDITAHVLGSPGSHGDTFAAESTDGGSSWSDPVRVSSVTGDYSMSADVGDYIGIDVAAGRVAAIWSDARDGAATAIYARTATVS